MHAEPEPRTTLDLIHELEAEANRFTYVFLIVAFTDHHEKISASHVDRLQKLNTLIEQGGIPLGFIGANAEGDPATHLTLSHRVLGDHMGDAAERADEVLIKIQAAIADEAEKHGGKD